MRGVLLLLFALLTVAGPLHAAEWVEVCAPGRPGGLLGDDHDRASAQAVVDLVAFDGGLYVVLAPKPVPAAARAGKKARKDDPPPFQPLSIFRYVPGDLHAREEQKTKGGRFGRYRVLAGKLHVPMAEPLGTDAGYYVSGGGGAWQWVAVGQEGTQFEDIAHFDGKTFLAGTREHKPVVVWRNDDGDSWQVEDLNAQAARFSYRASTFLAGPRHLSLLPVRDVVGEWPIKCAPPGWGAWYVLHYHADRSARGFLFDGQARPLPVLRALAPGTSMLGSPDVRVAQDQRWEEGLLFVVLSEDGLMLDPKGGLFHATVREGGPQVGQTFFGRRLEGMELARDVVVAKGVCAVLLANTALPRGKIVRSRDLAQWDVVFEGAFPSAPLSLVTVGDQLFVGLDDGSVLTLADE